MKKALIVLLILAVAGGLFAQSFSGSVKTGALFTFDGDSPVKGLMEDDWRGQAVRGALDFSSGGDDWGASIGASAYTPNDGGDFSGINVEDFNGWVKFADIFKLTAGKGVGDPWYFNVDAWSDVPGRDAGARLDIEPIDGLGFAFLFGYPNNKNKADKLVNFFEETAIFAHYGSSILEAYVSVDLHSPESVKVAADEEKGTKDEYYTDMDATLRFGVKVPLSFLEFKLVGHVDNLIGGSTTWLEERIGGNVVGLGWYVWAHEDLGDPLAVSARAGVDYGIPISDKASASVGADANLIILQDFSFDWWQVWGKVGYNFNDNVSTSAKLNIKGNVDPSKITPTLWWLMGYSF